MDTKERDLFAPPSIFRRHVTPSPQSAQGKCVSRP